MHYKVIKANYNEPSRYPESELGASRSNMRVTLTQLNDSFVLFCPIIMQTINERDTFSIGNEK